MRESKILDQYGNPISVAELEQQQTSKVAWLNREFSTHPTAGLTPARLANLLREIEMGDLKAQADLADDLERKDYQIFTEASKRKRLITSLEWDITVPRDATTQEKSLAEEIKYQIESIDNLEDVFLNMMDGLIKGYSCLEIEWKYELNRWHPTITHREANWFTVHPDDRNTLLLRNTGMGEPLRPFGWIAHKHPSLSGYITKSSMAFVLAWPYIFKNYALRDLAELLEIYGVPIGIGKYPSGASTEEKNTLLRALVSIGHNARGIIPEGMSIDFLEVAKGNADPFNTMIETCDRAISKCLVAGTLTSDSSGGTKTNALGNVHERSLWELGVSDAKQEKSTLTRDLVYPLAVLNGRIPDIRPGRIGFKFITEDAEDQKPLVEQVSTLINAGAGQYIPVKHVLNKLKIPMPVNGEPTFGDVSNASKPLEPQPQPVPKEEKAAATAALAATTPATEEDEIRHLADILSEEWEEVVSPITNPLMALAKECSTLEELLRRLPEAVKKTKTRTAQEKLARGMFMANVVGRLNADK